MRYLLNSKPKFNSFIFGNSRANNVDAKIFRNGKYYNMYYSLGLPSEYLEDIKLLLNHDFKIKNIILFLDYSSYSSNANNRENEMARKSYPDSKLILFKRYIDYAFQIPDEKFKAEFYNTKPNEIYKSMFWTGQAKNKEAEEFIENNKLIHISHPKFESPFLGWENNVDETICKIDSIKSICVKNKIDLKIVMNPIHKTTYLANNHLLYFDFIKKLSAISGFYDFSGLNKVTTNNYFYYETSHYRPIIGQAMSRFIQYNQHIDTIPDFGHFVSKENIDDRINNLKRQL